MLGNTLLYALPALSFPFLILELDMLDHWFVWWMDMLLIGYWSVIYQGAMVLTFLIAAINLNVNDNNAITI